MTALHLPVDAPFTEAQQAWLSGFLAGLAAQRQVFGPAPGESAAPALTVQVLYGTQTGTCEDLAQRLAQAAGPLGLHAEVTALDDVELDRLAAMSHVLVVTSTYGEGDMPDNAELFWQALHAESAPRLEQLRYAVLGLGDTGYDDFCAAGRLLDLRFEQLGATRLAPRVDCDVDFEDPSTAWMDAILAQLAAETPAGIAGGVGGVAVADGSTGGPGAGSSPAPARTTPQWTKRHPYPSRLVANRLLSAPGSAKEIRHLELDLGGSGITYSAGDALNVMPRNDPALVAALLDHLGASADHPVDDAPLGDVLTDGREIATPSKDLIALLAERAPGSELAAVVARGEREPLDRWLWGKDTLDLLRLTQVRPDVAELLGVLRPLQPRAYSISSSPLASPDRIHLTVASVRHGTERVHGGVCSTHLADRLGADDPVGISLLPNAAFGVPDDDAPLIMIGPGTGIAPFRGFLHERAARGAAGRSWLFFGDQHRETDFIYQDEIEGFLDRGVLTRTDLAFSRDQAEKVYVQTRMLEQGADLYAWLQDGGHVYVCGDASRMAKDVESALLQVVATHGGQDRDGAADYLARLKREKRYVRDVY
ncbi:MAG TPA: flavodoxin domain-containing protein [Cellulomonas sp.]